jgi:polysaccharide biosynthesis/export protein VpsN
MEQRKPGCGSKALVWLVAISLTIGWCWAAQPQEIDPAEVLRTAIQEDREPGVREAGPRIVTTENVMETVLEEEDVLELLVVGEPLLSMDRAPIAKGGAIHHPLLGEVKVAGNTLEEARRKIYEILLEDYLVDPRVSLRIVDYAPYEFTVTGEVRSPHNFSLPRNREIDVAQAIVLAGGTTRLGSSRALVERTVDGERTTIRVDLRKGDPVKVRHGDVIRVGERVF